MKHTMVIDAVYPSGAQAWHCPECGREVIITWPSERVPFNLVVLDRGDAGASHAGSTMGGFSISQAIVEDTTRKDEMERLLGDVNLGG